ncbi:MAG TPA: hypothetical protein VGJ05_06870 [Fimbriiglobus sp.]
MSRSLPILVGSLVLLAVIVSAATLLFGKDLFGDGMRPDLLTHKVKYEYLPVTVVERGQLESSENRDVICRVKAGSKGTYASTIKWVIDDGSMVAKGQLLMDLDDSALQDQFQAQSIVVEKAKADWIKADEEYRIQVLTNESDIATAVAALDVAALDLEKYLGVRSEPEMNPFGAVLGAAGTLTERGEFNQKLDDVTGRLKQAQSDQEAYRDRAGWAGRSVRLGYLTASQAKVEQSKYDASQDNVSKIQKEKFILEEFMRKRDLTDLKSKWDVARMGLIKAKQQAHAREVQAESTRKTANSVFIQERDKLREIDEQIRECKITAPQEGMVVYIKPENRWGQTQQGLIAQGEQVKEGQKMMRIPDLRKMQVNTKVHEAMVSRIRGDVRLSTGVIEAARAAMLTIPDPLSRLIAHSDTSLDHLREVLRDSEYRVSVPGESATIRVDAKAGRVLNGHVRSVAAVASQADFMSSDVKVYQTLVTIDDSMDGLKLKPDMSAEVTIHVDASKEPVLAVPLQAVVGGTEGGNKRKVFVITPSGPVERDVELGMFNDKMVAVVSGLAEGDEVVINPKVIVGESVKTRENSTNSRTKQDADRGKLFDGKGKADAKLGGRNSSPQG